jgi:hypothetical protein
MQSEYTKTWAARSPSLQLFPCPTRSVSIFRAMHVVQRSLAQVSGSSTKPSLNGQPWCLEVCGGTEGIPAAAESYT